MPSNKNRLYVALYVRGGASTMPGKEDTYHWALLVGPKKEVDEGSGKRYHAKEVVTGPSRTQWAFEKRDIPLRATNMVLVRIAIAKVESMNRLESVLHNVPVRQGVQGWNCVEWVREALEMLEREGKTLGTHVTEWSKVRDGSPRE